MAQGDTFAAGQIALTGAAQQLTGMRGASAGFLKNPGATNTMWVGSDNTVSNTTGYPIAPGQEIKIDVLNMKKLWVIGTAADRIAWRTEG